MTKSINSRNMVIAAFLVLFTTSGLWAEPTVITNSDLLRIIRQKDSSESTEIHTQTQDSSMDNQSQQILSAETTDILSGRDLLRIFRDKDGSGKKPSYAQREAEARKPVAADVDIEPTIEPTDKQIPTEPEEPITLTIKLEQPAKPIIDELLTMVPADSLFCLRVNNFDYTLNTIDQFLTGISPVPMGLSMLTRMQFASLLGSPQLNGVNMGGSFIAFGIATSDDPTAPNPANMLICILVPVTDYKQFIEGNPNCDQPDDKGISKITSEQALTMLATQVNNNYALLTPNATPEGHERLASTAKSISDTKSVGLASVIDSAEAQLAKNEPVWMYGNIQLISRIFGPVVIAQLEQMKTMGPVEAQMAGIQPEDMQNIMNIYISVLNTLMKEIKSVSLTINPKPNVLNITETVSAVPDTNMANMFVSDASAQQDNKLLRYFENNAAMNLGFKVNTPCAEKLIDIGIKFYEVFFSGAIKAEDIAKMKTLATDLFSVAGGAMATTISVDAKNKPPFTGKTFIEIKDVEKYHRLLEESSEFLNTGGLADLYKTMGMEMSYTLKRNADSYKGVSIDSARLAIKYTDPNLPQVHMISAMYGDGFDYRYAIVDQLCLCATCGNVDSTIREMIDTAQSGVPKDMSSEVDTVLAMLPEAEKADFVCTLNLLRFFKMITAMVPTPMPIPQIDAPTKSSIALAIKVGGGKMTQNIAVPKEHLTEIVSAVMTMQQQMTTQAPEHIQQLQKRIESAENLSSIGKAFILYANDNEDKYPSNLKELVDKVYLSPEKLDSPRKPKGFNEPSYIYITGQTPVMPPNNIIVYENPKFCDDKINVLFNDEHVEPMKPAEFLSELQATYKRLSRELPPEIQMMRQQMPIQTEPMPQQNLWTCPMHPQVQQNQKGQCPVCGADLIPVQKK